MLEIRQRLRGRIGLLRRALAYFGSPARQRRRVLRAQNWFDGIEPDDLAG